MTSGRCEGRHEGGVVPDEGIFKVLLVQQLETVNVQKTASIQFVIIR